jgi:beta-phosphoglucomutase-like phosphatase (HAD superfamily)
MLDATESHALFDATVTSEDVRRSKPAPDTFLTAAERLSVSADRCVVVEDAIPGVRAARTAGMCVIAVTTTRRRQELTEAHRVVDGLAELTAADFDALLR